MLQPITVRGSRDTLRTYCVDNHLDAKTGSFKEDAISLTGATVQMVWSLNGVAQPDLDLTPDPNQTLNQGIATREWTATEFSIAGLAVARLKITDASTKIHYSEKFTIIIEDPQP